MKTICFPNESLKEGHYAATIGFFDGVHRGHRFLISQLVEAARQRALTPMVITFDRHPRQVAHPEWRPQLLSTLNEKTRLISETEVDTMTVLHFDAQMALMPARDFMSEVLARRLHVEMLLAGHDNRFGHDRREGLDDYRRYGRELGIEVAGAQALTVDDAYVSSSRIRKLLGGGEVEEAARCLGRWYAIAGRVGHGEQVGRTMGFPTANLEPDDELRLIPRQGVYASLVSIDGGEALHGMTNIGMRPTFNGTRQTVETHILGEVGDLYGRQISVCLVGRLRDERSFDSAEALRLQLESDRQMAEKLLSECL